MELILSLLCLLQFVILAGGMALLNTMLETERTARARGIDEIEYLKAELEATQREVRSLAGLLGFLPKPKKEG